MASAICLVFLAILSVGNCVNEYVLVDDLPCTDRVFCSPGGSDINDCVNLANQVSNQALQVSYQEAGAQYGVQALQEPNQSFSQLNESYCSLPPPGHASPDKPNPLRLDVLNAVLDGLFAETPKVCLKPVNRCRHYTQQQKIDLFFEIYKGASKKFSNPALYNTEHDMIPAIDAYCHVDADKRAKILMYIIDGIFDKILHKCIHDCPQISEINKVKIIFHINALAGKHFNNPCLDVPSLDLVAFNKVYCQLFPQNRADVLTFIVNAAFGELPKRFEKMVYKYKTVNCENFNRMTNCFEENVKHKKRHGACA